MERERFSWLGLLALGLAAAAVVLWRRKQVPGEPLPQPMPEPPEPPRIVLPPSVLEEEEEETKEEQSAVEAETAEPPLLERAVGAPLVEPPPTPEPPQPPVSEQEESEAAQGAETTEEEITGYCARCRTKRPIVEGEEVTTESGRRALSGSCVVCGTRIFRFLPSKDQTE